MTIAGTYVGKHTLPKNAMHPPCVRCGRLLNKPKKGGMCRDCRQVVEMMARPRVMAGLMRRDLEAEDAYRRDHA